jgi:hypothetical protein
VATFVFIARSTKQSTKFSGTSKRISGGAAVGQRVVDYKALQSSDIEEGGTKRGRTTILMMVVGHRVVSRLSSSLLLVVRGGE